jgi:23S rRNA (adenine2030-N6)-methyltransferase
LAAGPAEQTGEWRRGIGRLLDDPPQVLAAYVGLVTGLGVYPGSPALVRALLRPNDHLICCELHPDEHAALRRRFARDPAVAVHRRDAWEALAALLPPQPRRGLVLIDPPYETPDEFDRLVKGLAAGLARFRTGVFAAWYPIKHRAPVRNFLGAIRQAGIRDIVAAELLLREPLDPARLNGCGMLVINPPYRFETDAMPILAALLDRLGAREPGEDIAMIRLVDE